MPYVFPADKLPEPVVPCATNAGDTYKETITDSTISSTTDANYKITRPRTTRVIHKWVYRWTMLSDEQYATLKSFWESVRTAEAFTFVTYSDNKRRTVRFTGDFTAKLDYPVGWYVSLTFEEV